MASVQAGPNGTMRLEDPRFSATVFSERGGALAPTVASGGAVTLAAPLDAAALAPATLGRSTVLPRLDLGPGAAALAPADRPRYERVGLLGVGGVGEVSRVHDNDIDRTVAQKRLRANMREPGHLARFVDEIRVVGSLEHPNIVPIHDVGIDEEGQWYFVMKYVEGETLESIIEKLGAGDPLAHRRFGFERRVEVFMGILEAVAYAHARGIVHRDLKPANVMVGPYGEVTVMDWGLAKRIHGPEAAPTMIDDSPPSTGSGFAHTHAGTILGTPAYMSPEQARGEPADERSDIHALSVILSELLSLKHYLSEAATIEEVLHGVQHRVAPGPSFVKSPHQPPAPADLSHFVRKGLAKDPAQRYQSVNAMIDRLRRRAAGDIPIECHITFLKQVTNTWSGFVDRHPFVMTAGMALGALGTVGSAVWTAFR